MPDRKLARLSRRERQIMDIVYRARAATAAEVLAAMDDPPSYSAVRATLRILEDKSWLKHRQDGTRYVYEPTVPRDRARRSALKSMLETFFDGSAEQAVAALLDESASELDPAELERIAALIERSRREGR